MALKYAPYCTRCGTVRTRHSSGLCSHCRRRPAPQQVCRLCGDRMTNHESGLCYRCRRHRPEHDKLDEAISYQKDILAVLEFRKQGLSYSNIAEIIGYSKSATYEIYRKALQMPVREIYAEEL